MSDTVRQVNDISNVRLTFDDAAGVFSHFALKLSPGRIIPTDWLPGETLPRSRARGPYSILLSSFNGGSPNGTWKPLRQ